MVSRIIVGRYRLLPSMSNIRNVLFDPFPGAPLCFPYVYYFIAFGALQAVINISSFTIIPSVHTYTSQNC